MRDFDFETWKTQHRHFLPGFHIYSRRHLACCSDVGSYIARMQQDLDDHYAGRNGRMYAREYTQRMQAWVEPYSRHIWQEAHIFSVVQELCHQPRFQSSSEL